MQWHLGVSLKSLAAAGLLDDVQEVADAGHWDSLLPPLLADNAKYNGRCVAIAVKFTARIGCGGTARFSRRRVRHPLAIGTSSTPRQKRSGEPATFLSRLAARVGNS
jgi:hypothetical protein